MTVNKKTVLGAAVVVVALLLANKASHASYSYSYKPTPLPRPSPTKPDNIKVNVFEAIKAASKKHNVPLDISLGTVKVESNFNPNAVSNKGAKGLYQIMPYPRGPKIDNPFDPVENADVGNRYLAAMYRKYNNWAKALAAFNWGPGNVDSGKKIPEKTIIYIKNVLDASKSYG